MYSQSSNPFSANGRSSPLPRDGSTNRLALDNLIRRELKVSDPNDPKQVAEALLNRYRETPRAIAIGREAEGVPFLLSPVQSLSTQQAASSSGAEMQQAIDDVERDLRELTTNNILKDVTPELEGWAIAIRSAIQEGINAARFALDPRQRDKTFGLRRTLGDYARIARLVGALTPTMSLIYRKFAQSLDEVASVLLVMMGEALSNVGFGGRYLLQAPYSELQVRRDAVIYALRNLVGATQEAYAPNEWPRGIDAYRRLFFQLEETGQGDLRALLVENELSRVMDALLQRSDQGSIQGLRQLGATAQLDIERLRRLVIVGNEMIQPPSPPLTAFLEALQLFVDGFMPSGGFRLLRIARPPILFYGLYGMTALDAAEERLLQLIMYRNQLADKLDCFMQCDCSSPRVFCQIILDKVLYDVDRAIDLYAVGTKNNSSPEIRAVAYSYIVDVILHPTPPIPNAVLPLEDATIKNMILCRIRNLLYQPLGPSPGCQEQLDPIPDDKIKRDLVRQELQIQLDLESRWESLVQTMVPGCITLIGSNPNNETGQILGVFDIMKRLINDALDRANTGTIDFLKVELPNNYEDSLKDVAKAVRELAAVENPIIQEYEEPETEATQPNP